MSIRKASDRFQNIARLVPTFSMFALLALVSTGLYAQDAVEINEEEIGSWFSRNWMWVVGGVILLLSIVLLSGRSRGVRKTTTVVKDNYGNVKSVTTTEEKP